MGCRAHFFYFSYLLERIVAEIDPDLKGSTQLDIGCCGAEGVRRAAAEDSAPVRVQAGLPVRSYAGGPGGRLA